MKPILMVAMLAALAVGPASGKVFTVNSTADAVDVAPGNGVCGTGSGKCTLRAAVMEANALNGVDTVVLPAGTFVLSTNRAAPGLRPTGCTSLNQKTFTDCLLESLTAEGDLDISSAVVIRGAGITKTFVDGANAGRVFDVRTGAVVQIRQLTVQNGAVADTTGGCIRNAGQLALDTVAVTGCGTRLDKLNQGAYGGGIANSGRLTMQGCQVKFNGTGGTKPNAAGGGIYNDVGGHLIMTRTIVEGNETAVFVGGDGAGVLNRGNLEVTEGFFTGNVAGIKDFGSMNYRNAGAAIFNSGGKARLTASTIYGNLNGFGGSGGGIGNQDENGRQGVVTVVNCTISSNDSAEKGGGIYNTLGGEVSIQNSTITSNLAAARGGGIFSDSGKISLKNSIVAGNQAENSPDCVGINGLNYSLLGNTEGCPVPAGAGNLLNLDPMLGPLGNNGAKTPTHALRVGSVAIDSASPADPGSGGNACEKADQRDITRPQNGRCDMGAYERKF